MPSLGRGFTRLVLLFGAIASLFARTPDSSLWRYVRPGSRALAGIQWSRVQRTEMGRSVRARWVDGLKTPGAEFLNNIEEVLISSPGVADGSGDEPPMLAAIRGNFDLKRIHQVLLQQGARKQMFGEVPIYRQPGKAETEAAFAILDAQTILAGDAQSLFSTIERSRIPADGDIADSFLARAQALAAQYDCWALVGEAGSMPNFLFSSLAGKSFSPETQSFESGISVRDGLDLHVAISTKTDQTAKKLTANLNRKLVQATQQLGPASGFGSLVPKLRITTDHANVLVSLRLDAQEAARSFVVQRPPEPAAQTKPPEKLVIHIDGLDDGPREVPFRP